MPYAAFQCARCHKPIIGEKGQTVCAACQRAVPPGGFASLVLARPDYALQWHWPELSDEHFLTAITRAPQAALTFAKRRLTTEQRERVERLARDAATLGGSPTG